MDDIHGLHARLDALTATVAGLRELLAQQRGLAPGEDANYLWHLLAQIATAYHADADADDLTPEAFARLPGQIDAMRAENESLRQAVRRQQSLAGL